MNQMLLDLPDAVEGTETYGPLFKRLYYHLYSNSNASRAETIVSDLANLLLCKAAAEKLGSDVFDRFSEGLSTAEELFGLVRTAYPQLVNERESFKLDVIPLQRAAGEIAGISFSTAPGHVLGDAFEALIGPRLRGDKGQFFTPRSLVRAIVKVIGPTAGAKIVDPACGTGGFLAEAKMYLGGASAKLIGIDKDGDLAKLAESMLEMLSHGAAVVHNANSLDLRKLEELPDSISPKNADFVITNPPFGTKIKVTDKDILSQYDLGHRWIRSEDGWHKSKDVLEGQDPQVLFIELCVRLLKIGGKLGIVLPEGIFGNKGDGYVWSYLRRHGTIKALIDCPRTTFQPGTDVKTNVLIFEKGQNGPEDVWVAVALQCGHDRRGRSVRLNGSAFPDDFAALGDAYAARAHPWQNVSLDGAEYFVPRYYDKVALDETGREFITIGELAEKGEIAIKKGHEVGSEAYGTGDIPFVRTSDINNYEISIDPTKSVSDEIYEKFCRSQKLASGDILMINDGRYRIGKTAILTSATARCVVQSHIRIISVDKSCRFDPYELLYMLNMPSVQRQIRNLVFVQSTLGSLGSRIKELRLPLPSRDVAWSERVSRFRALIEGRAELLRDLSQFEHGDLEL